MDIESKLIALVKSYEFLYKVDSDSYRDTLRKEDTWNKIGEQLCLSGPKCKKKWKNLRDSYKRLKHRHAQKPASEDQDNVKPWRYEEQLRFLDNVQSFRITMPIGSEQDCIQPTSLSRSQSMDNSDAEAYSNIEIKDELIISDPVTYITSSPPPSDTKIEIKDEIIVSDSIPGVTSIPPTKKQKVDNCTIKYNTIKNDGGIFYVSLPQKQQKVDNCFQSSVLENLIPNLNKQTTGVLNIVEIGSVSQTPLQKKQTSNNCFQSSPFKNFIPNTAKEILPQNQEKVCNYFQSTTLGYAKSNAVKETLPQNVENGLGSSTPRKGLQIMAIGSVSQPPQKKQIDSFFQSSSVSKSNNEIVEDSDDSSEDFQFSPVSYATSSPPTTPTLPLPKQENPEIEILYEKFEDFLESATSAVKELQEKSSNSTVILFESLAKKIVEANLTQPQISEIEHDVCMLVFTKLGKFMSENDPPKIY